MAAPATFEIEPIRATRTFEAAIEHLTEAVERAGLRTGDRLPNESVIAAQLGISKPTLRQALRVLELSGLVDVRRGKTGGIFVATDLVPAVALYSAVKLEERSAVDVLRARRVLERAAQARHRRSRSWRALAWSSALATAVVLIRFVPFGSFNSAPSGAPLVQPAKTDPSSANPPPSFTDGGGDLAG